MSRCLVVGGNGYLGRHVCRALRIAGLAVRVLDLTLPHQPESSTEYLLGGFNDPASVGTALLGCDSLIHLGWSTLPATSNKAPVADAEDNLLGSLRLFEAAVVAGVGRIVFASSGGTVYGNPQTLPITENHPLDPGCAYGISKLAVEKYLHLFQQLHGIASTSLRIANPYGPGQDPHRPQGVVTVFAHRILHDLPIDIWGDGSVVRDFVHVADVAEAFVLAAQAVTLPTCCNIGSGVGTSLNDLLDSIEQQVGRTARRNYQPGRNFDVSASVLDIQQARRTLGWQPRRDLVTGIRETLAGLASPA
jgi:UDP-glucose 4-epimerase